ncbi:hypothetical protein [Leptolyngbya sp. FACHB-711]|uniref:hypothetical protein n=1 Tax=Leptolyngbya sp. FACHB-711 TaxID=2692813 RepID=UPI0019AAA796|nr:hypothetical protein [Leptolyngbya sp. FACHB-711]MBD2026034.1 hypothetical protein [Leptolyngbya sp. FACHB-711]
MVHVLLIIDPLPADQDDLQAQSISAIEQAIEQFPVSTESSVSIVCSDQPIALQPADLLCPLTLNLPDSLDWKGQAIYKVCRDVEGLRDRVQQALLVPIATGEFWLPIVLTAKGALYAEAICRENSRYYQPLHLPDLHRQALYRLAHRLLQELNAPPSVYLLQFGWTDGQIGFDRLYPFPAEAAIASLKVQTPDLFACHWQCLTSQPIFDVYIPGNVVWR